LKTAPLPNRIKPSANFTSSESSNSEKKSSEYISPICILSTMENERLLGSDLNKFGKILIKKFYLK
jgi:hypothetical protein